MLFCCCCTHVTLLSHAVLLLLHTRYITESCCFTVAAHMLHYRVTLFYSLCTHVTDSRCFTRVSCTLRYRVTLLYSCCTHVTSLSHAILLLLHARYITESRCFTRAHAVLLLLHARYVFYFLVLKHTALSWSSFISISIRNTTIRCQGHLKGKWHLTFSMLTYY